jgi:hypothetical protein
MGRIHKPPDEDWTGRQFQHWTVLSYHGLHPKARNHMWLCRCKCGTERAVMATSLLRGRAKACGCLVRDKRTDLTGMRFGRLTVLHYGTQAKVRGKLKYECLCDCGNRTQVAGYRLQDGNTVSCGCYLRGIITKHGRSGSPEYRAWHGMKQRCLNPSNQGYKHYGKRGIAVCERWIKFDNFFADMGPRPSAAFSLERIDVNGGYNPENCRWGTVGEQSNNKTNSRKITHDGETLTIQQWSRRSGLTTKVIAWRMSQGWTMAQILGHSSAKSGRPKNPPLDPADSVHCG